MPLAAAQKIAMDRNLDLVKIAPQATPPVCRVMDYGKYRFEESKREREARKNQKTIEVKEIRLSLNIDTHDLEVKAKNAKKFLAAGNKLKIAIRFRGREMAYPQIGRDLMNKFVESLSEYGTVDKPPKMEGRSMAVSYTHLDVYKRQGGYPGHGKGTVCARGGLQDGNETVLFG